MLAEHQRQKVIDIRQAWGDDGIFSVRKMQWHNIQDKALPAAISGYCRFYLCDLLISSESHQVL